MALSAFMADLFGDAAERLLDLGGGNVGNKLILGTFASYFRLVRADKGSEPQRTTHAADAETSKHRSHRRRLEKRELPGRKWPEKAGRSCAFFVIDLVIDGNRHYEVDCGAKGPKVRLHWRDGRIQNALSLQKPNPSVAKQATPRDTGALS